MILDWIEALTPQQIAFASTAIGVPVAFTTLVGGALINAHLNRRRDDRLRRAETFGVATALLSEVLTIKRALERNSASLREPSDSEGSTHVFIPELNTDVWQALLSKVTLLRAPAIEAVLNAYGTLPIYFDGLAMKAGKITEMGSKRLHVAIPVQNALWVAGATESMLPLFETAAAELEKECKRS